MLKAKVNQVPASEAEIVGLREQLAQWRKANRPRARLPKEFWREAVGLARQAGMYSTMVQDTNGNQIQIQYKPALGSATVNPSARLDWIWDARAGAYPIVTYLFTYGTPSCGYQDEVPHLSTISTAMPTNENYAFSYACQGTRNSSGG
jgi:hypothetical protein